VDMNITSLTYYFTTNRSLVEKALLFSSLTMQVGKSFRYYLST
jgi:hypothetical protein